MVMPEGYVCVDLDKRPEKDGYKTLIWLNCVNRHERVGHVLLWVVVLDWLDRQRDGADFSDGRSS